MRKHLRLGRLGALTVLGAVVAVLTITATSGVSSAAGGEREYTASFEATCVVDPGLLNIKTQAKVTLHSVVPTAVAPGETFMAKKAHSTITTPVALTEEFVAFSSTEAKGKALNLVLEATGAEPKSTNIAKPPEFPEGLPFIAPVEKEKPATFAIPSLKLGETGLTYTAATWKVTATSGVVKIAISTEPGFTEVSSGSYQATGGGIVTEVEGLKNGSRTIGPLPVDCTAPAGIAPLEIPVSSGGPLEQGHPELYENDKLNQGSTFPGIQVGWGQIQLSSPQVGGIAECATEGFGAGWNEGSPLRAIGQVLSFGASGHVPIASHTEFGPNCRTQSESSAPRSFVTAEGNVKSESNTTTHEVEPSLRKTSTPWNAETMCGVRTEEDAPIVRIGVPTTEFPQPAKSCPGEPVSESEIIEENEHKKEREEKKGCYASIPAPAGCIRFTVVEPAAGLEAVFGGSLWVRQINGVHNGLFTSRWKFEGPELSGELQCEFPAGCASAADLAAAVGEMKEDGFKNLELMQLR